MCVYIYIYIYIYLVCQDGGAMGGMGGYGGAMGGYGGGVPAAPALAFIHIHIYMPNGQGGRH